MAHAHIIARPYAEGIFELARDSDNLAHWSGMLDATATVARDPHMSALTGTALVDEEQLAQVFFEACGEALDDSGRNLIRLLAEKNRLGVLPAITTEYERLRRDAEGVVKAHLITAQPMDEATQDQLVEAIGRKLDRRIELTTETDEALIGGAILRAGDWVIDGSARGQLQQMAAALSR